MMNKVLTTGIFIFLFICCSLKNSFGQIDLYDSNTIQEIEIYFSQPNWDYQMDTAKVGADTYLMAAQVIINGVSFDSVGVKYKGNSSYNPTYNKNPLHISINEFKGQSYNGYKDIKLSNGFDDPSMIREVLAFQLLKNYMDCPKSNFAKVSINGVYVGLYSNDENVASRYLSEHYYSSNGTFIKCNPIITPGPNAKCNLKYINADSTSYYNYYEMKSDFGWQDLVNLCDSVTNYPNQVADMLDVDRVLWMLAFNTATINLDSYTGAFCQNYYLYKDQTSRFNAIMWDMNMAFGAFPFVGSGNSSLATLTVANMQTLSPSFHATDPYWPLINMVMNNSTYKRKFYAHLKTLTNEAFASNLYKTLATQFQTLVDAAVLADTNKFYSYSQFQTAMTTNTTNGGYQIPGIQTLMDSRVTYLQGTTEFQSVAPTITNVAYTPSNPTVGDTVYVTCTLGNNNLQYVGYRESIADKFTYAALYDDGLHMDGVAGDFVYGAAIVTHNPLLQYYFYADNNNTGYFSPERAEHEFYAIQLSVPTINYGDITFNEILAKNDTTVMDDAGEYDDWFEIYNHTSNIVNLGHAYASMSISNPLMWAFPAGTIIQPHGVLPVWCDADTAQNGLHANFKLSASGGEICLANANSVLIDSITYSGQSADISYRKCPDGTGPWGYTLTPTYNQLNCPVGINELNGSNVSVYPNPTNGILNINAKGVINTVTLYNLMGEVVYTTTTNAANSLALVLSDLSNGMYYIRINTSTELQKIIVQK